MVSKAVTDIQLAGNDANKRNIAYTYFYAVVSNQNSILCKDFESSM